MPRVAQSMALTVEMVGAIPLIGPPGSNIEGLNCIVKRGFDIAVGDADDAGGVADFVARRNCDPASSTEAPLLFRQIRVGIHGKPFELLKFRTMRTQCSDTVHREYVKGWIQRDATGQSETDGTRSLQTWKRRAGYAYRALAPAIQHRRAAAAA